MQRTDLEFWRAREVARLLALVEGERRYYQDILAAIPVGVAILDARLGFLMANRSFRSIFGLTDEGLGRARLRDLFPGDEIQEWAREALEKKTPRLNVRVEYRVESGAKPLQISLLPFRGWDEDAEPELLLVAFDLEAGRGKPAATGAAVLQTLVEAVDAAVWERHPETLAFTSLNGRVEDVLGFPADAWLVSSTFFTDRLHPEDRDWVPAFYRASVTSRGRRSCEYRLLGPGNKTIWVRDVFQVIRDESGKPLKLAGVTTEITQRKLLEEQVVRAERFAASSRMAGRVAHECNNLLMIAGGYSEDLLANLPPDSPLRENVEQIIAATDRLSRFTGELLRFTRRPELSVQTIEVNVLVRKHEEAIRRELGGGIDLVLRLAPEAGQVSVDPDALGDALLAFAARAREVMAGGGQWVVETRGVSLDEGTPPAAGALQPGWYAAISLTDSGPALDEETRRSIFEPAALEDQPRPDLAAAYRIIREHGGDIEVDAGPGGGTRFKILVPSADAGGRERNAAPAETEPSAQPAPTVLVAEDEGGIRKLVAKFLRKQGFQVLEAASGAEALKLTESQQGPVHLLIADVLLGDLGGDELARRLAAEWPEMKVLLVSGYTGEELGKETRLPEGAEFLQKPFSLTKLLEKVRSLLERR